MNGLKKFHFAQTFLSAGIAAVSLMAIAGCNSQDRPTPAPATSNLETAELQPDFQSGPDGETILRDVASRYAAAKTYQDNAVLYLSYQLQGRNIQEPQRWSTAWDSTGHMTVQLFNGHVRCNGELLSCYVYDIETANLDNQHLLIPYEGQLPVSQLFRDSIARHFLGGYSELPLNETDLVSAPKLIPPPISLLTNQVRNGWLQNPTQVQRLADEAIDDQECFVVRCLYQGMTSDVWVDQATQALVQISLPLKLLAGEVVASPEITDVVLMAKFHNAVFDESIERAEFALKSYPDATPVLKFVALPETFPSELIGQTAPDFNLIGSDRKPKDRLAFDGKTTALLWLAGRPSYSAMQEFDALAQKLDREKFNFAAVYSDSELKSPGTGSIETVDELASAISKIKTPVYYDPMLVASSVLKINAIPSVIVLDGNSKVQFARALSNKSWLSDVQAAVERVAAGEDVANEMQREYQHFLDSYQQQLITVNASNLFESSEKDSSLATTGSPNVIQTNSFRLRPEKIWANSNFKQSGNVAVTSKSYLVFDGWRTVVELDSAGSENSRIELELPDGAAANLIRVGKDATGNTLYAVFSALGKQVFLFDSQWKPVGVYPDTEVKHTGIRDCQLTDLNADGFSELVVSFDDENGVHLIAATSLVGQKISPLAASSIAAHGDDVVITGEGKIGMLKTGLTNVEETELQFRRVTSLGTRLICGLGVTGNGQWNAVGFDSELRRIWTLSIGSQFFETEIEPVSVAQTQAGSYLWAIADTEDAIHLVTGGGKWLGDFQSETRLGGVSLAANGGEIHLLVSNASGVECWNLNLNASPMRAASSIEKAK